MQLVLYLIHLLVFVIVKKVRKNRYKVDIIFGPKLDGTKLQ